MENYHNWLIGEKSSFLELVRGTLFPKQGLAQEQERFEKDFQRISQAFDIAASCHAGELRDSGEPYFIHPLAVARILLQNFQNVNTNQILIALLHDTIESNQNLKERIGRELGEDLTKHIIALSKKEAHIYLKPLEKPVYHIQELFDQILTRYSSIIAPGKKNINILSPRRKLFKKTLKKRRDHDYFSGLEALTYDELCVKIADRLHNIATIHACASEKQMKVIEETYQYFLPVAEMRCPEGHVLLFQALVRVAQENNRNRIRAVYGENI